jgi:hypothetical protein
VEEGREVVGEEGGGGDGVEERLHQKVEQDGGEGAALPNSPARVVEAAGRNDDWTRDHFKEEGGVRLEEEAVEHRGDGVVKGRVKGGGEIDEGEALEGRHVVS